MKLSERIRANCQSETCDCRWIEKAVRELEEARAPELAGRAVAAIDGVFESMARAVSKGSPPYDTVFLREVIIQVARAAIDPPPEDRS